MSGDLRAAVEAAIHIGCQPTMPCRVPQDVQTAVLARIPEGAVLVTEESLARALFLDFETAYPKDRRALARDILRHLLA